MQRSNSTSKISQTTMFDLFGAEEIILKKDTSILSQSGWFAVYIEPKPAPRPRATTLQNGFTDKGCPKYRATVYNPTKYTGWKKELAGIIRNSHIKADAYNQVEIIVGIAIRKSYKKAEKISMLDMLHDKKPDYDNFEKGILDAIQQSGKIHNDSLFGSGTAEKVWIDEGADEFILINLVKRNGPVRNYRKILENASKLNEKSGKPNLIGV